MKDLMLRVPHVFRTDSKVNGVMQRTKLIRSFHPAAGGDLTPAIICAGLKYNGIHAHVDGESVLKQLQSSSAGEIISYQDTAHFPKEFSDDALWQRMLFDYAKWAKEGPYPYKVVPQDGVILDANDGESLITPEGIR